MKELEIKIENIKNVLLVDSRMLAKSLDHRHRNILENIDKYSSQFNSIDQLTFETEAGYNGSVIRYAILTEDHCYFLLTLMRNNNKVVSLKVKLVKAFRDARNNIAARDLARIDGKEVRKLETKSIHQLVEYASAQGSENANKYYMIITKMVNKIIGVDSGQRDNLNEDLLRKISLAEQVVEIAIRDGIRMSMPYKDIYKLCKNRVELTIDVNLFKAVAIG